MKIVGIVAEYNPLHTGHQYQLNYAREVLGADYVIVAMSGDFTQRGLPAIFDKHTRAQHAICCGADLVLELPVLSATASAEGFSYGALRLLASTGVVDELVFGCEKPDLAALETQAELLLNEPAEYKAALQAALAAGDAFPAAKAKALEACGIAAAACTPNDILAVEYIKAIKALDCKIRPVPMQRLGAGYDDESVGAEEFASATGLRHFIEVNTKDSTTESIFIDSLSINHIDSYVNSDSSHANYQRQLGTPELPHSKILSYIPPETRDSFLSLLRSPSYVLPSDFDSQLNYALRRMSASDLCALPDCDEALAARILKLLPGYQGFIPFADALKSKNYTHSRITRVLCHCLLGITAEAYEQYTSRDTAPYLRILGVKDSGTALHSAIYSSGCAPLVITPKELDDDASMALDVFAADLNTDTIARNCNQLLPNEFTRKFFPLH